MTILPALLSLATTQTPTSAPAAAAASARARSVLGPISEALAEKYRSEGAEQIGVHGSMSPATIEGVEIVYGNLLDDGEKVRHHPEKLAQVALLCALQPREKAVAG